MSDVPSVENDRRAIEAINLGDVPLRRASARGWRDGPYQRQVDAHSSASAGRVVEDAPHDCHR